jgi:tetratricopeptide (TPR) repeat protein
MNALEEHARSLFLAAVERAPDEWPAFLDQACGADAELRARVDQLLHAHQAMGSIHGGAAGATAATSAEPRGEGPGTVIGPYKLLEQIGEGGFGVVFMAEQTEPIRRKVALKILKPGMDTRQVVARFEAERQALALMDHPNIARVLDGGQTASGRPYFVMDLVKGLPITEYCDQAQLAPRARLELFVHLCQAVQHAHQKGIIHRDLKPSNVLVTVHDTTPVVKVIDFGVAKALGQELTDKTLFTGFAQMIGTPLYMSPEQAGQSGLDIDTRSDIYSLGVLLYELLTGTTPFDKERLREVGYDELRRIIREEEPPRPSTRISTLAQAATAVASQRRSDPQRLSQLIRGELDWIVMKALEKDRGRRYETAGAFAADVQCYLKDEPVLACPPSAWYRFGKFTRRHKTALAVAGLILFFVALLGGGVGWVIRNREAREQEVARERLDWKKRLTAQVEMILDEVDRLQREQKWPEALAAARRADAALADGEADDALRQRVRAVSRDLAFVARLDRIWQDLAVLDRGKPNHRRAARDYALAFRAYGVDVEALPAAEAIARLQRRPALAVPVAGALDVWRQARVNLGEGERSWRPLVTIARALDRDPLRDQLRAVWTQPATPDAPAKLRRLAESINVKAHSPATVLALAQTLKGWLLRNSAIRILRDGVDAYPGDYHLNYALGSQLHVRKDYEGAGRHYSAAVALRPDSAAAHYNLGVVLLRQKKLDEASACFQKAIALGLNDVRSHLNLGVSLAEQKKLDQAIASYQTAIKLDPKCAEAYFNLGTSLAQQKKLDRAIACFQKAIKLGLSDARAHNELGTALTQQNKLDEAIASYQTAIKLDPKFAPAYDGLGTALALQGKPAEAIACYQRAIKLDPNYAPAYVDLSLTLVREGKLDEAFVYLNRAIVLNPNNALAHNNLGGVLFRKGDYDGAIVELKKAIALDPKRADSYFNLGLALMSKGDPEGAVTAYRTAIALDPTLARAHYSLGNRLRDRGDLEGAIAEYRAAIRHKADHLQAHLELGYVLRYKGDLQGAIVEFRKAIAIKPDSAEAHCHLGDTLKSKGEFREALKEMRRAHELGSRSPGWRHPSEDWVRQCQRLVELDEKLPEFLDGTTRPAGPAERIELARLCAYKRLNRTAARFFEEAFAAKPALADDLSAGHRYQAACVAALAGCGKGEDVAGLDEKEKARLRGRALCWLRADLAVRARQLAGGKPAERIEVQSWLRRWLADPDLGAVRGPEAVTRLPEAERQAWQTLWKDVADILERSQGKVSPEKK